jgi:hypothetical protein
MANMPCMPAMPLKSQVSRCSASLLGTKFYIEKISMDCIASNESGVGIYWFGVRF